MGRDLLSSLAPRLKDLSKGGYARAYRRGASLDRSSVRHLVGSLLGSLKIPFEEDVEIPGAGKLVADFHVNGTWVFVDRELGAKDVAALRKAKRSCLIIRRESLRTDRLDHGVRILGLEEQGDQESIFLDDPSFNFDYAHILPKTQKCSVMHGHTSSVLVEVVGRLVDGMVVDFGFAKEVIREAVRSLDHKLFINEKYVTAMSSKNVALRFKTVHGDFAIRVPKATTVLLASEATVENLAREVLSRVAPRMPDNVTAVGVYVYEGFNKGSHIVAQIHEREVEGQRRRR